MSGFRRVIGIGSVLALVAIATYFVTPAGAAILNCGAVVTQSTTLDNDVVCPAGTTGITVRGSGITLNLNGHKVSGVLESRTITENRPDPVSTPTQQRMPDPPVTYTVQFVPQQSVGILILGSNNTVTGGTVEKFAAGFLVTGGNGNRVQSTIVRDNVGPPGTDEFGDGILVSDSNDNVIQNNQVLRNGPYGGITLLGNAARNQVLGNQVHDNYQPDLCPNPAGCGPAANPGLVPQYAITFQEAMGIKFEGEGVGAAPTSASFNTVMNNVVTGSGNSGILSTSICPDFGSPNFTCEGSHANEGNIIKNNQVNRNGFGYPTGPNARTFGGPDDGGSGILMFAVGNNVPIRHRIEGNQVVGNSRHGVSLGFSSFCINPLGGPPCEIPGQVRIPVPSGEHTVIGNTIVYNNAAKVGDPCPGSDCNPTFNGHDANQPSATFPNVPPCDNNTWKNNRLDPITPDPDPDNIPGLPDNPIDPDDAAVNHPCVRDNPPSNGAAQAAEAGPSSAEATPSPLSFSRSVPAAAKAGLGG